TGILRIAHRLEPGHVFTPLGFLHGDMFHAVFGGRTVPMFLAWGDPDGVTGPNFMHRSAPRLDPADARGDEKRLTKRIMMPGGPSAGLEAPPRRPNACRVRRLNNGILPYRPGETRCTHPARRARSAS